MEVCIKKKTSLFYITYVYMKSTFKSVYYYKFLIVQDIQISFPIGNFYAVVAVNGRKTFLRKIKLNISIIIKKICDLRWTIVQFFSFLWIVHFIKNTAALTIGEKKRKKTKNKDQRNEISADKGSHKPREERIKFSFLRAQTGIRRGGERW